jgi:hypothetical protein
MRKYEDELIKQWSCILVRLIFRQVRYRRFNKIKQFKILVIYVCNRVGATSLKTPG